MTAKNQKPLDGQRLAELIRKYQAKSQRQLEARVSRLERQLDDVIRQALETRK